VVKLRHALLSVSDKTGLVDLARALRRHGVAVLSTGGTAKLLREAGIAVTEVADYTGYPEMLDGRVKTLHPKIHAGLLARRESSEHMAALNEAGIEPIDLVVVNLYPFSATVARPDCSLDEAIENIDVGGPSMLRAAAKNYRGVAVLTDPADYAPLLAELDSNAGVVAESTRFALAKKAFAHTAAYDTAISRYLAAGEEFPPRLALDFERVQVLRYGENPHQRAAFYRDAAPSSAGLANFRQLQGRELSYNNLADADAAWDCVSSFDAPACVIVKHANPCGVALGENALAAYQKALATDPVSAFGGIIALNVTLDEAAARAIGEIFVEVLIAPEFHPEALAALAAKPNVRVLQVPLGAPSGGFDLKKIGGGLLVQTSDRRVVLDAELRVASKRAPAPAERADLLFAWRVAKFVKSNAIVFAGGARTLGIGAGQMSRVDSTRIAVMKAANAGLSLAGAVVASDAFFPFRDGVDVLAEAGAKAIIQPGGSMRDQEVIEAADAHGIAILVTGVRHFRH
jgi:phosphoribosylaminoimidazolecarboxamide formyltransferase/IMP cyclohydrolase